MKLPFTQQMLINWAGESVFKDAELLVKNERILDAAFEPPLIKGSLLWNNRSFQTSLKMTADGNVENMCPCRDNKERGIICAHVIALGIVLVRRAASARVEADHEAEIARAARRAAISDSEYIKRAKPGDAGAVKARMVVTLGEDWPSEFRAGTIPVVCEAEYKGKRRKLEDVPRELPLLFDKNDESLSFVLEDICDGPAKSHVDLNAFDFLNVVHLQSGKEVGWAGQDPISVNEPRMTTHLKLDMDRESGELVVIAHTELPFMKDDDKAFYVVSGRSGWVYGAGNFWPLENVLPAPYHAIYEGAVRIARDDVVRFLRQELPVLTEHARMDSDVSADLFTVEPGVPRLRLVAKGSPASVAATCYACYGSIELVAGKPHAEENFGIPDPKDLMRYTVRNLDMERRALAVLAGIGFRGEYGDDLTAIVGDREVLNCLGSHIPTLRRRGWQVELDGKVAPYMESLDFATPVVRINDSGGGKWFDVGFEFEDGAGQSLSHNEIQRALRKGEFYVQGKNGKTILIDSDAVDSMLDVFSDCSSGEGAQPGHFRMSNIYAPFVKSSLDALDGIDIEDTPVWRDRAGQYNRTMTIEDIPLGKPLEGILRSYQKEGVNWLRFLEKNGFCGLLADEMGLGKTVQTLAWLQLERHDEESRGKPSLIVCPTSIVENWAEEIVKFVPAMKVTIMSGPDRHAKFDELDDTNIAITSYALMRRDVDKYLEHDFAAIVLDEAQHIKNRSTQNAVAAKKLEADHRLVLTGTPIENGVSDLWSIMDFLMPGYMGNHASFRTNYELPVSHGGPGAELAQIKLRRKLHPFLLRRLKIDVAKDLPPKIEKISSCTLTKDQRMVYNELLESSRRKIGDMVAKKGFNKCRMEILTTLMRLRQICCHLDLLKLKGLDSKYPSGKMDLFFELLDEALDSGHRILVFSQFVSMLHILRDELKARKLSFCYLDGSTKNRMKVVHQFNTQRDIPVFLISLKAGGTGLNLTGADMVIHFDPWWNPAVENQATDRAYRIGQERTVYSLKLITRGTVEEKVLALQEKKQAIIDATIESDDKVMQSMTWDDIQELLEM
jgi:superfamily II DNA or RNA helicase